MIATIYEILDMRKRSARAERMFSAHFLLVGSTAYPHTFEIISKKCRFLGRYQVFKAPPRGALRAPRGGACVAFGDA